MSKKDALRYQVLTTCIITALNAGEPATRGSVYTPEDEADVLEAKALASRGFVKETTEAQTVLTVAQRRNAAGQAAPSAPPLSGIVDGKPVDQGDGTWQNARGERVNEDGTPYQAPAAVPPVADAPTLLTDEQVAQFLGQKADDIIASLEGRAGGLAYADQLIAAEQAGKGRVTVVNALTAAKE